MAAMTETLTIPGYSIAGKLGQGGMASVYLAVQHSFEREVALKVMSPLLNTDPSFAVRFKREARIVAQLRHASIVPVFDVGEHESCHYLSMEYLPGGDLKRKIAGGTGDLALALNVITALSAALDEAHRKGFVHRDIKPENILFREDGTPVLTDFGIARALDSGRSMTVAGMLVGTPDYMSPEQVKGLELDGRADLYSLGIAFYEILTGTVPFKADSTLSVALKQVSQPLPPLPPEFGAYQEFFECLTAKDRDERFGSGAELIRALRVLGTGRTVTNPTSMPASISGNPADTHIPRALTSSQPISATLISQPTLLWPRGGRADRPTGSVSHPTHSSVSGSILNLPQLTLNPSDIAGPAAVTLASGPKSWLDRIDRPMWMGAVALLGLAVGVVFIVSSLSSDPYSAPYATVTQVAPPAAMAASQVAQQLNTAQGANPQPTAGTVGVAVATPVPAAATPAPAVTGPLAPDEQPSKLVDDSARHKRPAQERHRKADLQTTAAQNRRTRADELALAQEAARLQAQEAQIQQWLIEAQSAYAAGALWQPSGASAADRYRDVLKLQPARTEAVAGMQRVVKVLAAEAARTISAGDVEAAKGLIGQITALQPGYPALAELQNNLARLEATASVPDARDRGRLAKAARFIARAHEDLGRNPLDFKAVDDATDQYDKAQSAAAQAPGLSVLQERLIAAYIAVARSAVNQHDTKRALKLINSAHKRNWSSDELDQIEVGLASGEAPAKPIKEAGAPEAAQ
jgi:serine/threonine protein kinase